MANFIVMQSGKPTFLNGYSYRGFLWNKETGLPFIDPSAFAIMSEDEQQELQTLLHTLPQNPETLIQATKKLIEEGIQTDSLSFRRDRKEQFFLLNKLLKNPLARKCMVKTPSKKPLPHKLAVGVYEFNPSEVTILKKRTRLLMELQKAKLIKAFCDTGIIDSKSAYLMKAKLKETCPEDAEDKTSDPITCAAKLYDFRLKSLNHFVDLFDSSEAFFDFVARRAEWRRCAIKTELQSLNDTALPDNPVNKRLWKYLFLKQMRHPYDSKKDLVSVYSKADKAEQFSRESGINLATCDLGYVVSMVHECKYKRAEENPELAKICGRYLRYPEYVFNDALDTMKGVSEQDFIPDIYIDGILFGMPDYELYKFPKNDPFVLIAGAKTNCCGHIGGGKSKVTMVRAMVTQPDVGAYGVRHKGERLPSAKLTVWRSITDENGESDLVINAWTDNPRFEPPQKQRILYLLGQEILNATPSLRAVYLGKKAQKLEFPLYDGTPVSPSDPAYLTKDIKEGMFVIASRDKGYAGQIRPEFYALKPANRYTDLHV